MKLAMLNTNMTLILIFKCIFNVECKVKGWGYWISSGNYGQNYHKLVLKDT